MASSEFSSTDSPSWNLSDVSTDSSLSPKPTRRRVISGVLSLFKNVKRGKACFKCHKIDKTVHCCGKCNKHFHLKCIRNNNPDTKLAQEGVNVISNSLVHLIMEPILTSQENLERPSTSRENNLERPSTSWEYNLERPSTSRENNLERPSTSREVNLKRPSTSREVNSKRPSTSREVNLERPSTSREVNLERPSTSRENALQRLTSQEKGLSGRSTIQDDTFSESTQGYDSNKARSDDEYTNYFTDEIYYFCNNCLEGKLEPCFICNNDSDPNGDSSLLKCCIDFCGKMYHYICLKNWPVMKSISYNFIGTQSSKEVLICPRHFCRNCEQPNSEYKRNTSGKLVTCIKCPAAYHYGNECILAGSEILSRTEIICPVHFVMTMNVHVSTMWCLECQSVGQTLFCTSCPVSYHHSCMSEQHPDSDFTCSDCKARSFPIYGDIVWVIGANYRTWPAKVIHPSNVPKEVNKKAHEKGEFVVKCYVTNKFHWTNRGSVFKMSGTNLFNNKMLSKKTINSDFKNAIRQAIEAIRIINSEKIRKGVKIVRVLGTDNWLQLQPI